MGELGIKEIPEFKPLSERAVDVLSEQQDRLVAEIEQLAAREPPDKGALAGKVVELAQTQAQINVKEGGGHFSGGGVRRFVTEDPKSPFPGYGPGEAKTPKSAHGDYLAASDPGQQAPGPDREARVCPRQGGPRAWPTSPAR